MMTTFGATLEASPRPMNSMVDVGILQKLAHKDIVALLQKCHGDKALVWDRALANPMNLITKHTDLKEQGVVRMLSLEQSHIPSDVPDTIIFICRPLISVMELIARTIRNEEKTHFRRKFHLFLLPRTSRLCLEWLKKEGVLASLQSVEELPIFLFPLDKDVISLEQENAFRDFYLDMDPSGMYHIAKSLVYFQKTYGVPNQVFAKGTAAKFVYDIVQSLKQEGGPFKPHASGYNMDCMILLDRKIDLLSPLVTQLTYEGLIDEFYGINNNQVKFPEEKFGEGKTMMLSSGESLYMELRDKNFSAIGSVLRSKTSEIQEIYKQKDKGEMSMGEMKRLVQQLPAVNALKQSLSDHASIAELIKSKTEAEGFLTSLECEQELISGIDTEKINPVIENLCCKKSPLTNVLRLIVIQCITSGGLKTKVMQHYEKLIIQNYGFQHALTLQKLFATELFRTQDNGIRYAALKRALNLSRSDVSETKPDDFTFVHSIYAPLTIRLIQYRLKPNLWASFKDSVNLIPGQMLEISSVETSSMSHSNALPSRRQSKFTVVVFIGGCTFAEISALRFLAQQDDEREYLVVTSKIINGNSFLKNIIDTP